MKYIGQFMVITSVILAGASLDGFTQGWFGFGGLCIRLAFFAGMFLLGLMTESNAGKRKRAKRVTARKAQRNNKYKVICHE